MVGLLLGLCLAQPVGAGVIPVGDYHPLADSVLDLTGAGAAQFQRVVIDAGITLRILTPADGRYAQLLATDDIVLNGVMDAGAGALNLVAGNRIVMGSGARLVAGNTALQAQSLNLGGAINTAADASLFLQSGVDIILGLNTYMLGWTSVAVPLALETFAVTESYLIYPSPGTLTPTPAPVPEPATWLLLLTGLALLVQYDLRRDRRVQ
ncbi:PEP-CTERM sorting domain-containing protein [Sulfuriferula sp.]|uniref:PEP-CTERM sorting domain-containing protein n=1 Tax=Sulfuriferula sp. TaxID=2025307 RepID=UPI00272F1A37|nr:PEP-CTERM sorting domain-containing protein [Sulfuriferula sp.]MDP2027807.1 PEP-CTERM sorting domain-containing protein [Sulfuriferula sp.]